MPMTGFLLNQILEWLTGLLLDSLNALFSAITHALLITPDVTNLPQVQALTGRSVWVVDTAFVLVFVAAGLLTMVGGSSETTRYSVKDLLPRCVVAFTAAHFSQLIAGKMIELANAFTLALTGQDFTGDSALTAIKSDVTAARDVTSGLLFVVCVAIIVFLLAATALSVIVRFTLALVLAAAAPLALALHALPQTEAIAWLWWRSFIGVLAVPVAQGFVLSSAQWMLLDPHAMLPLLGLPTGEPGGVLNLFTVMVLLWVTVKVPGLMRRYASSGARTQSMVGTMVRIVVVQQLARGLPIAGLVRAVTR